MREQCLKRIPFLSSFLVYRLLPESKSCFNLTYFPLCDPFFSTRYRAHWQCRRYDLHQKVPHHQTIRRSQSRTASSSAERFSFSACIVIHPSSLLRRPTYKVQCQKGIAGFRQIESSFDKAAVMSKTSSLLGNLYALPYKGC